MCWILINITCKIQQDRPIIVIQINCDYIIYEVQYNEIIVFNKWLCMII